MRQKRSNPDLIEIFYKKVITDFKTKQASDFKKFFRGRGPMYALSQAFTVFIRKLSLIFDSQTTMTAIRFILVGILNTLVGLGVIYAAMYFLGLGIKSANLAGYGVGLIVSFTLNKTWTFKSRGRLGYSLIRYLIVIGVAYLANLKTVVFAVTYLKVNAYLAQSFGVVPYALIGYLGCRFFAFPASASGRATSFALTGPSETLRKNRAGIVPKLAIVVPCYNEEEVLPETNRRLTALLARMEQGRIISGDSRIYYVDDGSKDGTWAIIAGLSGENKAVRGIKLSRNRGHQNALLAGLYNAEGDVVVSIDADLQDDTDVIMEMVQHYRDGFEIVYGVRSSRKTDAFFKRYTAQLYYRILKAMGVDLVYNHADYRLMSRKVIDCLKSYREVNLFLRGIIPQLGFPATVVYYERHERFAGESKYPLAKMLALALDGITSFSVVPLRMITWLGLFVSLASIAAVIWILVGKFVLNSVIPGWTSTVLPIYFLGGVQLLSLGILGEYLSKIYMETKERPRFFIEEII